MNNSIFYASTAAAITLAASASAAYLARNQQGTLKSLSKAVPALAAGATSLALWTFKESGLSGRAILAAWAVQSLAGMLIQTRFSKDGGAPSPTGSSSRARARAARRQRNAEHAAQSPQAQTQTQQRRRVYNQGAQLLQPVVNQGEEPLSVFNSEPRSQNTSRPQSEGTQSTQSTINQIPVQQSSVSSLPQSSQPQTQIHQSPRVYNQGTPSTPSSLHLATIENGRFQGEPGEFTSFAKTQTNEDQIAEPLEFEHQGVKHTVLSMLDGHEGDYTAIWFKEKLGPKIEQAALSSNVEGDSALVQGLAEAQKEYDEHLSEKVELRNSHSEAAERSGKKSMAWWQSAEFDVWRYKHAGHLRGTNAEVAEQVSTPREIAAGSTLTSAMIKTFPDGKTTVTGINVGDTALVVYHQDGRISKLYEDHSIENSHEQQRLKEAGASDEEIAGFVYNKRMGSIENTRDLGCIGIRKRHKDLEAIESMHSNPLITTPSKPKTVILSKGDRVVLMTDGVYKAIQQLRESAGSYITNLDDLSQNGIFSEIRHRINQAEEAGEQNPAMAVLTSLHKQYIRAHKEATEAARFSYLRKLDDRSLIIYTV